MKGNLGRAVGLLLLAGLASCAPGPANTSQTAPVAKASDEAVKPFLNPSGTPFRIGVVQSGDYYSYNDVLVSIRKGLTDLGWASAVELSKETQASIPLILQTWQNQKGKSSLVFPPDKFVDLNWTEESEPPAALKALLAAGGVDLVISLGTLAGTMVKKVATAGGLKVPVMIESVSDPVGSKIIDSFQDSGNTLITASADPEAYDRQIRLFHRVVGFKRLGLIYTDTDTGRAYAALPVVTQAAKDLGFEIVADTDVLEDPPDPNDIPKAEAAYVKALETLGPKVDAVYLAIQAGLTPNSLAAIRAVAEKYKLPTFVMEVADYVWRGALFGESNSLQTIEGLYSARKLTRILAGTPPRELPQTNPHMPHIALNLAEANRIGYDVPVEVLLGADDVYTNILTGTEVQP